MEHLESRRYAGDEHQAGAFEALCRMVDRLEAHAMVFAVRLTEPEPTPLVVLLYDDPAVGQRITTGHWHGGEPYALPPEIEEAFLRHAAATEEAAGGRPLRRRRTHPPGTRIWTDGRIE